MLYLFGLVVPLRSPLPKPRSLSLRAFDGCSMGLVSQIGDLDKSSIDLGLSFRVSASALLPRKEVIQPHLPIRLPCYDFTPVIGLALGGWLLAVTSPTLGTPNSHGVTGGVYKARERIHRGMLIRDY